MAKECLDRRGMSSLDLSVSCADTLASLQSIEFFPESAVGCIVKITSLLYARIATLKPIMSGSQRSYYLQSSKIVLNGSV